MYIKHNKAGLVLGAGGFGCVFYPAIKCKNKTRRSKGISKLGYKNEIDREMKLYKKIDPIIKKIKNYRKFFLINEIKLCKPSKLTKKDMVNLEKCVIFNKIGIEEKNINRNLSKFRILNIPYGGQDLLEILENKKDRIYLEFYYFNSLLFNLINYAIIPMNKLNLFHNDIKSNNLLLKLDKKEEIKIIDWGLASIYNKEIPFELRNRGIQFNLPFSCILFLENFREIYSKFLKENKIKKNNIKEIKNFCYLYVTKFFYYSGHTEYITNYLYPLILSKSYLLNNSKSKIDNLCLLFIINYLSLILLKFTNFNNSEFNEKEYYNKVFIKNSDIWGFLSVYLDILLVSKDSENPLKYKIQDLIIKYLYSLNFSFQPIPLNYLLKDIQSL